MTDWNILFFEQNSCKSTIPSVRPRPLSRSTANRPRPLPRSSGVGEIAAGSLVVPSHAIVVSHIPSHAIVVSHIPSWRYRGITDTLVTCIYQTRCCCLKRFRQYLYHKLNEQCQERMIGNLLCIARQVSLPINSFSVLWVRKRWSFGIFFPHRSL